MPVEFVDCGEVDVCAVDVVGVSGNPGQANYAASKAGMIGMAKSLAQEVGTRGITVNCIAPGFITSPMTDVLNDDQKSNIMNRIPVKKIGDPGDIASAAGIMTVWPMNSNIQNAVSTK